MTCAQLLRWYGTKAKIGAAIKVDRQVVQGWFERDKVPLEQQVKYEIATAGALRADVGKEFRDLVARGNAA